MRIGGVEAQNPSDGFLELDTHADVAVLGSNCRVFQETERTVQVYGYDPSHGSTPRKIVSGVFAYDDPHDGHCKLLIVHQGIHVPTLQSSLIPPYQMRDNDVVVNDCPKSMMKSPTANDHAIIIPRLDDLPYRIPLMLKGTISGIPVRRPTDTEFADMDLERFELTYETPEWDQTEDSREKTELNIQRKTEFVEKDGVLPGYAATKQTVDVLASVTSNRGHSYEECSINQAVVASISHTLVPGELALALRAKCMVGSIYAKPRNTSNGLTAEQLAKNWMIPIAKARATIEITTQRGIRTRPNDLVRRFKTNDRALRYRRLTSTMFTDTMESQVKSKRQNKYAQVYTIPPNWIKAYGMKLKSDAHHTLSDLLKDVGAPEKMVMDGSKEQVEGLFRSKTRDAGVSTHQTEPHTAFSNQAELAIRELKMSARRKMRITKSPQKLWDDCLELEADIISNTAHEGHALQGQTPQFLVTGQTTDISRLAEFGWYQWVYWYDDQARFPAPRRTLGRYLGPTRDIGTALTAKLIKSNGQYAFRSSFVAVTDDEMRQPETIKAMEEFTKEIDKALKPDSKDSKSGALPEDEFETPTYEPYEDDEQGPITVPDAEDVDPSMYDPYVNAEVLLPFEGERKTAKVKNRKLDDIGQPVGKAAFHPMLDTRQYVVEFPDGSEATYAANIIAENMIAQCDSEGRQYLLVKHVLDHKKDDTALTEDDATLTWKDRKYQKKTTKGWSFCVEWNDGTSSWLPLSVLKEQIPVEIAEYATLHGIASEPAFRWWVPWTLKKRDAIISAVSKRYHKRTHKFGIAIPKTLDEAIDLDKENKDTKWQDAMAKEMKNVMVAFKMIGKDTPSPPGYQQIRCHLIFDIKMDNFARKARMVAGGHTTETPSSLTYASVVSRDSVRIALTMAALNDLEVKAGDIQNAYLQAPCSERITTVCGPEFGELYEGQTAILVRALYGLKSSGAAFRNHLADCMRRLGYKSCLADPDVWYRPEVRPSDGQIYYAYVLLYVDDALVINHDGMRALREIHLHFRMKEESMGDPDIYLGCKLRRHTLPNGVTAWLQSPSKYIQEAVKNAETYYSKKYNMPARKKVSSPFSPNYRPEMDSTAELDADDATKFQSEIGILRWIVEIGRVDIITEVSLLSTHLALPRIGHLMQVWHIYQFLRNKHNGCLIFDPTYPAIDMNSFNTGQSWKDFYGDVKEMIPSNAPKPRGRDVVLRLFVDSDHAGEELTRRSRTGFILYMNMAPILWFSKRQGTIETSVFGAEFVAMKVATEAARGMRYKLRMMGIPIDGPTYIYGDNMSVIHNTQRPESVLKKKSNAICYHFIRESVAMGESLTGHVRSENNPADICTKIIAGGVKRDHLTSQILYFASNLEGVDERSVSVGRVKKRAKKRARKG